MQEQNRVIHEEVVQTPGHVAASSVEQRTTVMPTDRERRMAKLTRAQQIIYFIATTFAVIILLRILLLALGANQANGFANFVYALSNPLVAPFQSLFGQPQYGNNVFEFSSLVAIAAYYLLAWGISKVVTLTSAPPDATGQMYK